MLSNAQVAGRQALNVVLLGQPDLDRHIDLLSRDMLGQRIRLRCHLEPLSSHDTCRYIEHRMWAAGDNGRTQFPAAALDIIYQFTGGVPRLINILCDMTLLAACQRQTRLVGVDSVLKALATLQWQPYTVRRQLDDATAHSADLRLPNHRARLELTCEDTPVGEVWLTRERMLIGRRADQDLCIDDPRASRAHAQIVNLGGEHYLYDLDSTNGTRVNARRVRVQALSDGDVIRIGAHELKYVNPSQHRREIGNPLASLPAPRVVGIKA
ncbi:MAG: FHA domain-containing protein [Pseudomonadota bacterium]|nr:MAG: FHA domain-containing protein [Pseudomonadota bacterium]